MRRTRRLPWLTGITLLAAVAARATAAVPAAALTRAEARLASTFAQRGVAYPPQAVTLIALKAEARLELWADGGTGWTFVRSYLVRSGSGSLGPKLAQGDHQVPEGVYRIDAVNPDSRFHLALRLDYPNEFDRAHAATEGRSRLGGDIMIHGGNLSDGCLPIGDPAIEDVYALVDRVGTPQVAVIVSPVDLRRVPPSTAVARVGRRPRWLRELYDAIADAMKTFPLAADGPRPVTARRLVVARPSCKAYDAADCVKRCERGNAQSCARAGLMYREGRGTGVDLSKAWTFLEKACAGRDGLGCAELGQLYLSDDGLRRDASRAATLAAAACDAGEGHGCSDLVKLCADRVIYPTTEGQCSDATLRRLSDRAVAALRHECRGWGAYDCDTLATIYAPDDRETALGFASRACQGGDPGGCDDLGRLYEDDGDAVRARALYRRACEGGYATACDRVGGSREG
jgi:TPR repeat protein